MALPVPLASIQTSAALLPTNVSHLAAVNQMASSSANTNAISPAAAKNVENQVTLVSTSSDSSAEEKIVMK